LFSKLLNYVQKDIEFAEVFTFSNNIYFIGNIIYISKMGLVLLN